MANRPCPEGRDLRVKGTADPRLIRPGDPRPPLPGPQPGHPPCAWTPRTHTPRSPPRTAPVDTPPPFEDGGEETGPAELGDLQIHVTGHGSQQPGPAPHCTRSSEDPSAKDPASTPPSAVTTYVHRVG